MGNLAGPLGVNESRSHFGAWAATSSPLILGLDLTNASNLATVWAFVSNPEVRCTPAAVVTTLYHGHAYMTESGRGQNCTASSEYQACPSGGGRSEMEGIGRDGRHW